MQGAFRRNAMKGLTAAALLLLSAMSVGQSSAPGPSFGRWGFDLEAMDLSVRPGDSFFAYANGRWLQQNSIPGDQDRVTLRRRMEEETEAQVEALLEDAALHAPARPQRVKDKVGAFYKTFLDAQHRETLGGAPLREVLRGIAQASSKEEVARLMGRAPYDLHRGLFSFEIYPDLREPTKNVVYLNQSGLGLPDRDYYLEPGFASVKAAYRNYIEKILGLVRWPDSTAISDGVLQFESRVAEASWSGAQSRDVMASYNPTTWRELPLNAPGFPWHLFLKSAHLTSHDQYVVAQKSAFPALAAVFSSTSTEVLRAWLAFSVVDNAAPFLSSEFTQAHFEFRGKVLNGLTKQEGRIKSAVRAVSDSQQFGNLAWAVGQLYVEKSFSPETKKQVEALVETIMAAYRRRIDRVDWLSDSSRQEALRKLDAYIIKIGYPTKNRDYSKLMIRAGDPLGNARRSAQLAWNHKLNGLKRPVDRNEWFLTPQTDDAVNTGSTLTMEFPAAVLQPPMFDPQADPAVNYGAIGAYMSHEIAHAFDDQGRKLDHTGQLRDWWTTQDAARFEEQAARLGAQYARYEPLPGLFVNPRLTMGENIADLGGVTVALDAYRTSHPDGVASKIDGFTGEQRYFLGWAQAWRGKLTDAATQALITSDSHAPRNLRVDGAVRNLDEWNRAFDVAPNDRMYLEPEIGARIW